MSFITIFTIFSFLQIAQFDPMKFIVLIAAIIAISCAFALPHVRKKNANSKGDVWRKVELFVVLLFLVSSVIAVSLAGALLVEWSR